MALRFADVVTQAEPGGHFTIEEWTFGIQKFKTPNNSGWHRFDFPNWINSYKDNSEPNRNKKIDVKTAVSENNIFRTLLQDNRVMISPNFNYIYVKCGYKSRFGSEKRFAWMIHRGDHFTAEEGRRNGPNGPGAGWDANSVPAFCD